MRPEWTSCSCSVQRGTIPFGLYDGVMLKACRSEEKHNNPYTELQSVGVLEKELAVNWLFWRVVRRSRDICSLLFVLRPFSF